MNMLIFGIYIFGILILSIISVTFVYWIAERKIFANNKKCEKSAFTHSMPNPTQEELRDPIFNAVWDEIKTWDVNIPKYYVGHCGANGSHAVLIYRAIKKLNAKAVYSILGVK